MVVAAIVVMVVEVRRPRGKYLMLHTRPRTLHVHDEIPHMLHCMAYTSSGDVVVVVVVVVVVGLVGLVVVVVVAVK